MLVIFKKGEAILICQLRLEESFKHEAACRIFFPKFDLV